MRPRHNETTDREVADHALDVLLRKRDRMPLTVGFMQAVSHQVFGHKVGEHRAARMIRYLRSSGRIVEVGRYRGKQHGFWVTIYRVIHRSASVTSSVRRNSLVKSRAWWKHPLFGTPDGKPPPETSKRQRKWWKDPRFLIAEKERAWAANEVS